MNCRPGQEQIIAAVLAGRDVLAVMRRRAAVDLEEVARRKARRVSGQHRVQLEH